nr:hypothetical protein Iba_chr02bCG15860 [Ipomoea batatas]
MLGDSCSPIWSEKLLCCGDGHASYSLADRCIPTNSTAVRVKKGCRSFARNTLPLTEGWGVRDIVARESPMNTKSAIQFDKYFKENGMKKMEATQSSNNKQPKTLWSSGTSWLHLHMKGTVQVSVNAILTLCVSFG